MLQIENYLDRQQQEDLDDVKDEVTEEDEQEEVEEEEEEDVKYGTSCNLACMSDTGHTACILMQHFD